MKLVTYLYQSQPRLGVWHHPYLIDIIKASSFASSASNNINENLNSFNTMKTLLEKWDECWDALTKIEENILQDFAKKTDTLKTQGVIIPLENVHLMAPVFVPGKVICVAGNFPEPGKTKKPDYPTIFLKPASTVTGFGVPILVSEITQNVAVEVELALVINRIARHIPEERAKSSIAGYILANDIGDRLLEKRTSQWTSGKMFDTFTPMGPWLATKDEIIMDDGLEMTSLVNGQIVQKGNTRDMFFDCAELVSYLSDLTTLYPGDIILTGSPKCIDDQPNPKVALEDGDRVSIRIEGLGELTNPVVKEQKWL